MTNNASTNDKSKSISSNRMSFILLLLAFIIPAGLAYVVLKTDFWQTQGTANNGTLISPVLEFDQLELSDSQGTRFDRSASGKLWWVMFVMPPQCDVACKNALYQMRQLHVATGPERHRVTIMLLSHEHSDSSIEEFISTEFPKFVRLQVDSSELDKAFFSAQLGDTPTSKSAQLYLMDPMGVVFMTYPSYEEEHESIMKGKLILKDLQRVLKLSRIG